jgi:hypothetical protein
MTAPMTATPAAPASLAARALAGPVTPPSAYTGTGLAAHASPSAASPIAGP